MGQRESKSKPILKIDKLYDSKFKSNEWTNYMEWTHYKNLKKGEKYRLIIECYEFELIFCYYYPEIQNWKIYRPLADKKKKWFTNVPFDYIEGMNRLNNCDIAFISKSKKDYMVLKKALGLSCIIISQAEDLSCFNEQTIEILKKILILSMKP